MLRIWPVFKRELAAFFVSPVAYAMIFVFLVVCGYFFYSNMAYYALVSYQMTANPYAQGLNTVDMVLTPLFGNISVVMLLMVPALTMRLFAEEKKTGTFELLLSYPLRDVEVLLGKFLAALTVFSTMIGGTVLYLLLLIGVADIDLGVAAAGYLGLLLAGAAFIATGLFISSLTENQIVAAAVSFGVLLLFWGLGWSAALVGPPFGDALQYVSLLEHMMNFSKGILDTSDIVYYLMFTFFFLFLTLRSLESNRWRG